MTDKNILAELLATKLCHDLVGPVGAVANGVEFLFEEMPELETSQAAQLIKGSVAEASARLQFMRQAFGQNSSDTQVSITETRDLTASYFAQTKITLNWPDESTDISGASLTSIERKIIMNLMMIAGNTLIKGGELGFQLNDGGFTITGNGEMIKFDDVVKQELTKEEDNNIEDNFGGIDARKVQYAYTKSLIDEAGKSLDISDAANMVQFKIT